MNVNGKGLLWLSPLALAVTLAACGGDDNDGPLIDSPGVTRGPSLLVMHNGPANSGQIDRLDASLSVKATFSADANEGIALDLLGNLYAANDSGGAPSRLQVLHKLAQREDGTADVPTLDRTVAAPGSMTLKGIAIAHRAGLVMAANIGGNSIEVYGTAAGGMATSLASTALAGNAWDLAYDEAADRLFLAMTNGTVLVVDDYVAGKFLASPARVITPATAGSVSNLHGIAYRADTDTLVVSDVGDAGIADDGRLYVIEKASTANGVVTPARTLAGAATQLGNPVDLVLDDDDVYIAEKSNDAILVYRDVFSGGSGNIAPDKVVASIKPESLTLIPDTVTTPDLSDIDGPGTLFTGVAVTSNPPASPKSPDVVVLDLDLGAMQRGFITNQDRESLAFNHMGDAYVSYDGGLAVINRLALERDGESFALERDRLVTGTSTGLTAPKGFDVADKLGWVLITDNGNPSVRVFGAQADGNVAPLFSTSLSVAPWDLDYDPQADRLYVALTNGTVAVFDRYSVVRGASGPDRVITPATGGVAFAAPTNLHGIVHVAKTDQLIVSDVGSGANTTDGKIYVLDGAASADGLTNVSVNIDNGNNSTVGQTQLGNPVDIAFDGQHLYVAEKSQGKVLRFDNILGAAGGDLAPSFSWSQSSPESVSLIADDLGRAP
ncbi:NHL repeat containing protein [Alcanivorax hongdengensis A-11-3]|uniref:NHL repeat containing protein n=1 Tax=Alcanivorax hongdengensis A-11-3 TaxID=1177179 RepID=L0WFX3_9GAMM|nr:hypothetical protein [Alcanivorax hongdengensis]EKF75753.1 NHL repeat containing protein [Alcanivorax hongdengensis A-11-3]